MAISKETIGRLYASGRNYINLGLGFAAGVGIVSAGQQKEILDSFTEIYNGIAMIAHGGNSLWTILSVLAAPIVGPILARMASNSAKVDSQAQAVKAAIADPNTPITVETKAAVLDAAVDANNIKQPIKVEKEIAEVTQSSNVVSK